MKKKIVFLTEGSKEIGFGHIIRSISLYQAFEEAGIRSSLIVNGDEYVSELINEYDSIILDWINDKANLEYQIKNADIAIIDSYTADLSIYNKVEQVVRTPVYFDDFKRLNYPRGIIINGSLNAEAINYQKKDDIVYLLGSSFLTLRKEFWNLPAKEINENIDNILLTFGGSDERNLTPCILQSISHMIPQAARHIIIGKGFDEENIINIKKYKINNTYLYMHPEAELIKNIMLESDVAISSAGQTLCELARIGSPAIAITTYDNQINNAMGFAGTGFISYAGNWNDAGLMDNIKTALELLNNKNIREERSKSGRKAIDGNGARNITNKILSYL